MNKGTLKGLGLVLASLLIGAVIIALSNVAQAEDKPAVPNHCIGQANDSIIVTQCDNGQVTVVNVSTSTVMVCNTKTDGTPVCITQRVISNN